MLKGTLPPSTLPLAMPSCTVLSYAKLLLSSAFAMRCRVLSSAMLLPGAADARNKDRERKVLCAIRLRYLPTLSA
eukprot:2154975-Rhodomonas_salina.1